jgi:hypothetical protein
MPDPGDLTTLQSVKTYTGRTSGTADDKLSALITACSGWVKSYLNRDILQATYTETINGTGTRQILLGNYPVTSVTALLVCDHDVTSYALSDGRRTISLAPGGGIFDRDIANVSITYVAGFATVPADLEHVVCRLVAWGDAESGRLQQVSKSMGGEVVTFSQASAPSWALDSLKNWRKVIA